MKTPKLLYSLQNRIVRIFLDMDQIGSIKKNYKKKKKR